MDTIHQAIYQTDVFTLVIEYELIDGDAIAINNVNIQARPLTQFEQRERTRHTETLQWGRPSHLSTLR